MSAPLLSVCLITYNHVKFIRQAIEGVIMQKVNFSLELIIADDFSTDGTREIITEYANRYPDIIRLILQDMNVGAAKNWRELITAPKAKYIAYLEGDDFWSSENKLLELISFLEANNNYSAAFHNVTVISEGQNAVHVLGNYNLWPEEKDLSIADLIESGIGCPIASASLIYRKESISDEEILEISRLAFGDRPLEVVLGWRGRIRYFPNVMAVYRKNAQSATAKFNWNKFEKDYEAFFLYADRKLNFEFSHLIDIQLKNVYLLAAHQYYGLKMYNRFMEAFYKIRKYIVASDLLKLTFIKLYIKYLFALKLKG